MLQVEQEYQKPDLQLHDTVLDNIAFPLDHNKHSGYFRYGR